MINNYSSVLFLYLTVIFCCCMGSPIELKILVMGWKTVVECAEQEYLVINDWYKLKSSDISCPNQAQIFKHESPDIYNYSSDFAKCDDNTKTFSPNFYASIIPSKENKNNKFTKKQRKVLSTTINVGNITYSFKATQSDNSLDVLVNNISLKWSSDNEYILYTIFQQQPIICRMRLIYANKVKNGKCSNEAGRIGIICYHKPLSKPLVQNIDWTRLEHFLDTEEYQPKNWIDQGGYYLDARLLNIDTIVTTTTTSTTTTTTSISTTTKTTSTTAETTSTTAETTSTTTKTTSTTTTATSTTAKTTSTATTATSKTTKTISTTTTATSTTTKTTSTITTATSTTTETTSTTTKTTSTTTETTSTITKTTSTTTTTLTSDSTPTINSTWISSVSPPIITTNLDDDISTSEMTIGTTTLSNAKKTSKKIVNITPKSSTKTSRKLKSPKNNSAVLKNPSSKKNSSSRSNVFILLLILFILCIISSMLFFIYRFRQNRQGDNQSLLDRVGSEESSNSDMNESETNSLTEHQISTDANPELAEIDKKQKGGRMLSQLDPDAL